MKNNSELHRTIVFISSAEKDLIELPNKIYIKVIRAVNLLKNNQDTSLDIKKLKGYKTYFRIRTGNYRVIFRLTNKTVRIIGVVSHRKDAYKKMRRVVAQLGD